MEPERIDRKDYPSFGECIYCGARAEDTPLTDEHIVPYSLGANAVILDGSCKPCAAQTTKIEKEIGRRVLWDFRTHIGERTRRPKDRPKTSRFKASIGGAPLQEFELPIADAPFFTFYPVWGLPGILRGVAPQADFLMEQAHAYYWLPENIRQLLGVKNGVTIEIPYPDFKLDNQKFARALAKMAFCQAVVRYGLHGFRGLATRDLILGNYPYIPHFVGSEVIDPPPPTERTVKHAITLFETTAGRLRLLQASIRLYSNSGTLDNGPPIYDVIVGALR